MNDADPIPDTFVKIAHMLDALSWEQRRRVLAGINAFYDPTYDKQPVPAALPTGSADR